ncbi:Rv0361 family membrane protein [Nocardia sp. NBC_00416]|uniref:Rv0361 family membrane protein n=1 Tax=Nocardia sp. NBC_00416 TaxID=2975991 RepID=UPI002E243806
MSNGGPADEPAATEPDGPEDPRTIWPFIVAAVIVALILGGVLIAGLVSPVEKNVTDSDRIAGAVRDFAQVSNRYGVEPPREAVCPGFVPARSPLAGQLKPGETGKDIEITKFGPVDINGDTATIEVTSRVEGEEKTAAWWLFLSDGDWQVCNQPVE